MNEVSIFNFNDSFPVRTVTIDAEIWFVGKDICQALGYTNSSKAINDHCRGVTKCYPILDSLKRKQEVRILSEADVMRLICGSNLPSAVKFERWVFEDVLPSIRKTGKYAVPVQPELPLVDSKPGLSALLRMKYKGVPVIPTPDLANVFGLEHWNLLQFIFRNRKNFTDNVDMFRVKGVTNELIHIIRTSGSIVKQGCSSVTLWTESGVEKMQILLDQSCMGHKRLVCSEAVPAKQAELPIPKRTGHEEKIYHFNLRTFFELNHELAAVSLLKKLHDAGFEVSKEIAEVQFLHFAQHKFLQLIDSISADLLKDLTMAKEYLNEENAISGTVCMKDGEWRGGFCRIGRDQGAQEMHSGRAGTRA